MNQMNKDMYLKILRQKLHGLEEEDIEDAISYVSEYFEEAGEGNEGSVWRELGSPSKFAATIKADSLSKRFEKQQDEEERVIMKSKSSLKRIVTIAAGIMSLPLALPLLLVVVCLIFVFLLLIVVLGIGAIISLLGCVPVGIISIVRGIFVMDVIGNGMISIGAGLISIGFGVLLFAGFSQMLQWMVPWFSNSIVRVYQRVRGENLYEKE